MTRFSVVEAVRHLIAEYRSFIKSCCRLAGPRAREAQIRQCYRFRRMYTAEAA